MRNLKRALSLALASVMLMGMMVVGSSAASYPDVDDQDHVKAIEVLSAVGVIVGDNGNFRPDDSVSRNEMAVIMAKLILGTYEADSYVGNHPFTDVPDWASKYVAACYNSGIIAGRTETTYDGTATVTAVEAAAMMLRALGYEDLSKGAAQWDQPVAAKANEINLFVDLNGAGNAAMDRDSVAQLALNTLQATMVTTVRTGQDITLPDGTTISATRSYEMRTTSYGWKDAIDDEGNGNQGGYLQLGEYLYRGDLTKNTEGSDNFGRDAEIWSYKNDEIISAPLKADKTYVGEVSAKDIYADLGLKANITAGNVEVYENSASDSNTGDGAKGITRNDSNTKFGTDGQTVEVYYTAAKDATPASAKVCIVSTYLGVVVDEDFTQDNKDGIRVDVFGESVMFYEAAGYSEDDVVLLTVSDGEIQSILGAPETVSGEVTRVGTKNGNVTDLTIDKTKYPQSVCYDEGDGDVIKGADSLAVSSSYTLYLDRNNCYLAAVLDEDNSTTDLVYLHNVREGSFLGDGNEVNDKVMATVVYMDGTFKSVSVDKVSGNTWDGQDTVAKKVAALEPFEGKLVDLKYDEDDKEYTMNVASEDYTSTAIAKDVELKTDSKYANFASTNNTYLNDSTVYLFVKVKEDDATKIDSVDTVTGGVSFDVDISEMNGSAFATKKNKSTAEYVVIMAEYEAAEKDILYIKSATKKGDIKDGQTYEGYYAGETAKVEIPVDDAYTANVTEAGFYEYSERSNGNLKVTKVAATDAAKKAGALMDKDVTSLENNLIQVSGGYAPYDLTGVKVVDLTDRTKPAENEYGANITSLAALRRVVDKGDYTVNVSIYVNGDNEVKALFINTILEGGGEDLDEGTPAKLEINVTYKKDASEVADPTWTANDTVVFSATGLNATATYKPSARAASDWQVTVTQPANWTGEFDGAKLTLTAPEAGELGSSPVSGAYAVTVTNSVGTVSSGEATGNFIDGTGDGGSEPEQPGVTSVTVAPDTATVAKGGTQKFTATVVVTGGAEETVNWTVTGGAKAGTAITADGTLTVAADETAATLTVTATSTVDSTKKGTATVTVSSEAPAQHVHNLTWSEQVAEKPATCTEAGEAAHYTVTCSGSVGQCDLTDGAWYASTNSDSTTDAGTAMTDAEKVIAAKGHTAIENPGTTSTNYAHQWNSTNSVMQHAVKCKDCDEPATADSWENCDAGSDGDSICNICGQTNISTEPQNP